MVIPGKGKRPGEERANSRPCIASGPISSCHDRGHPGRPEVRTSEIVRLVNILAEINLVDGQDKSEMATYKHDCVSAVELATQASTQGA